MRDQGSLFGGGKRSATAASREDAPLPERQRPESLDELVGLDELIAPGRFLRSAIESDRVPSIIFWGPPGSGKTTLARIIAKKTKSRFVPLSATSAGIKDVKAVLEEARMLRERMNGRTIVFIDEIHRFNKAQQDAFLPYVEAGDIVLIGATTENPSFEVNSALLSRSKVVVIPRLEEDAIAIILDRALKDPLVSQRGLTFEPEALAFIGATSGGDARQALNSLQLIVETADEGTNVDREKASEILQRRSLMYDKSGEEHYNIISAVHKSIRNSDPDAAIYWTVRMLEGGEDPMYIARRLVRTAIEDIGLADPQALNLAIATKDTVHFLGMPEGGLALVQLAVYLAVAPKSNAAYVAYGEAQREVREGTAPPVPLHLRNAPTRLMKDIGYGSGYQYAHDFEEGTTPMPSLPESLAGRRFYEPESAGFEKEIRERIERIMKARAKMK